MKRYLWRAADAVFVTRPLLLIPVWGYFILGYYRAQLLGGGDELVRFSFFSMEFPVLLGFSSAETAVGLCLFSLLVLGAYVINQLVDIETDKLNEGLPLIAKAGFPRRLAVAENILLFLLPAAYAVHAGGKIGWIFLFSLLLAFLYSIRPFRFSGRPLLDGLSNALGYGFFAFSLGWVYANRGESWPHAGVIREAAPYFFLILGGSINSTVPDEEGDRKSGKQTTVVAFGRRAAGVLSFLCVGAVLVFSVINRDWIAGMTAVVSLPFYLKFAVTTRLRDVYYTYQHCGAFMMFLTVAIYPWFFLYGLVTFLLTRLYFWRRHGVVYPKPGA